MPNSATLPLPAPRRRRSWAVAACRLRLAAVVLAAGLGFVVWWKFFSSEPQPFADARARFHYGSLGGELVAGIPYPIFMILPRVFPDLVERYATEGYGPEKPGYGGYGAFGLAWEEGERLPVGLSIKRLGQERVTPQLRAVPHGELPADRGRAAAIRGRRPGAHAEPARIAALSDRGLA